MLGLIGTYDRPTVFLERYCISFTFLKDLLYVLYIDTALSSLSIRDVIKCAAFVRDQIVHLFFFSFFLFPSW